jgi:hypothetical protein
MDPGSCYVGKSGIFIFYIDLSRQRQTGRCIIGQYLALLLVELEKDPVMDLLNDADPTRSGTTALTSTVLFPSRFTFWYSQICFHKCFAICPDLSLSADLIWYDEIMKQLFLRQSAREKRSSVNFLFNCFFFILMMFLYLTLITFGIFTPSF